MIQSVDHTKESMAKNSVSLNLDQRKKEKEQEEEKRLALENKIRAKKGLKLLKKGETPSDNSKNTDAELEETGHILADYILMTIG